MKADRWGRATGTAAGAVLISGLLLAAAIGVATLAPSRAGAAVGLGSATGQTVELRESGERGLLPEEMRR